MQKNFFAPYFLLMSAFFIIFSISLRIQDLGFYKQYLGNEKCFTCYIEINALNYAKCGLNMTMIANHDCQMLPIMMDRATRFPGKMLYTPKFFKEYVKLSFSNRVKVKSCKIYLGE